MLVVGVVVMDCTLIGAPPPTGTLPTMIWRVTLRGVKTGGGILIAPRFTAGTGGSLSVAVAGLAYPKALEKTDRTNKVGSNNNQANDHEYSPHRCHKRHKHCGVQWTWICFLEKFVGPTFNALDERIQNVPAI